ncbi:phosphate ABC transporter ATP-binding protein [Bacteriovorax sp. Seq25_V]|uniref:phosphate ABC transporter ATP-binding protein n=1 Tax=Bacteriovorax sp. Seq25_V TaxID=1201288 RepID=UPI00038A034A|nr:phosphate ABC transporter ATP-binding protein [Bacteriovorax sp. Seq25_V]EQC47365.1 putative phosphate ABC transporter, ATP-binding protein PstB [Bacteriovorax sp. Seq25_V]
MNYPWKTHLEDSPCCPPSPVIEVKNLSLFYKSVCAFKDITLTVNRFCVTGIIGPSGCGKSSFLQAINRLIENISGVKITGDIIVDGISIFDSRVNLVGLRKKIGLIFQEPTPLPLSIYENIALPLKEHHFDNIDDRVREALSDVGLWDEVQDKLHQSALKLSGGQKQRLCIARSIALDPEIILLDEPCSSLDPISTEIIEKLIIKLKSRFTIVIVTHNLAQARRVCDHLCAFWYDFESKSGYLLEEGSSLEIFDSPKSAILEDYIGGIRG